MTTYGFEQLGSLDPLGDVLILRVDVPETLCCRSHQLRAGRAGADADVAGGIDAHLLHARANRETLASEAGRPDARRPADSPTR